MNRYDVIVIGCGAGGYNTAIRASQLGLQVACVERGPDIGGAGLRTGCVPSRLLLHASALYDAGRRRKHAALGIDGPPTLDLARLMAHKTATVQKLSAQVRQRLRAQHVTLVGGHARLDGAGRVIVTSMNGAQQTLSAPAVVIATGSEPIPLAAAAFDHARILDSTDALSLDRIPRHLAIVGAGAAGVELGSLWRRLGARVTLVERRERICHWLDHEIAAALDRALRRQGIGIRLSTEVVRIDTRADGVSLALRVPQDNAPATLDADAVLIAIGRRASTAGLNLASVGMWPNRDGALPQRHASTGIWTVGDAAIGPMSMTKAEEEAIACAEQIAGLPGFVDYSSMPAVLYTSPEVATIGKTEDELRFGGVPYKVGRCALAANAHAAIHRAPEGFVKLLVDARTNLIAGAHLIGAGAAELVSQVAVAMEASMICEDFARVCHPYPAWSEALRQAAMAAGGWMMHG
ncbi:dihydrolipoamide dehydrogenase [Paraburkholderia caballeronis]|uniref:dihydrolipoyl dehydrogenase family protein n=1 Tax=Paraburkholderia caballeronis TaxID=416943 RepID=UPI001065346C|nr:NAD(P)/FAD-dependent oxidoreductase [Paraburkholderia caballeronis]TDV26621.1 dihydrolipoamide dehydrogenase [Paraburkholderia caballeronis]